MKNRILSVLLAALLLLSMSVCTVSAESAGEINLLDMSCTVDANTYAFPVLVSDLADGGLTIPDVSGLTEGQYYPAVEVNDGRNSFSLRVEYCASTPDERWATGCILTAENNTGAVVGGMTVGETTRSDVIAAAGEPTYDYGADISYYLAELTCVWNLTFEDDSDSAKLTKVSMYSDLICQYGDISVISFSDPDADLPDPASMPFNQIIVEGHAYQAGDTVQAFLDNGWALPLTSDAEKVIAARSGSKVSGDTFRMYNGECLIEVSAYNLGDAECALKDCVVNEICVSTAMSSSMTVANGVEINSVLSELTAALGEPASVKADPIEEGVINVVYDVLNGNVHYTACVAADSAEALTSEEPIFELSIRGLMQG